jgi:hypothetical protein
MSYPYGPPPQQQGWGPAPQQPQQGGWQQPPAPQQPGGWGPPQPGGWQQPQPTQPQWGAPPQQQAPEAPAPAPIPGTLADFYSQPSTGGGQALKFNKGDKKGPGYFGVVTRAIRDSDTQQQTGLGENKDKPQFFRDGRPKMVLKIPLNIARTADFQDGKAQWWCGPSQRDQLVAAIAASGAPVVTHPSGVQYYMPEPGSGIYVEKTGTRPSGAGLNDSNVFDVRYFRPEQARQIAAQQGVEYPTVAELAQTADAAPAEQAPSAPAATPPGPPPSRADFAPPTPGQPGNPAQWSQQPAPGQFPAQAPGQFPAWGAVDGQQGAPQGPPPQAPQQPGPGAPPPVDWATQGQQPPNGGGYIPQATPPTDLAPGLTLENQQLMASMTGRGQQ